MRESGFLCRQCGHCCINVSGAFSACATVADIERWEAAGRDDILAWVDPVPVGDEFVYDLWIDPETGDDVIRCPWLEKAPDSDLYVCRIHDLKPDHCREYPISRRQADETGCPGYATSCREGKVPREGKTDMRFDAARLFRHDAASFRMG